MTRRQSQKHDSVGLLSDILERSAEARFVHRLHCIILVRRGVHASTVAEWFNYAPSTIARWVSQFNRFGIEGLKDTPKPGRPKILGSDQLKVIKKHVAQSPLKFGYSNSDWDGKCLQAHLEAQFGVSLSIRQCQRLLKQLRNESRAGIEDKPVTKR